ncbi:MAG: flagellin FliC [Firmicutes bacterium]|nr:flagellin FliC [Bacillota bacterium]
MALVINQNIAAIDAHRNLVLTGMDMSKAMERLSSGLRINRAADDAAGLAISEKLRSQVRGLNQGIRNAQDGISLIQTAEGALNETHSILQRMRELAVQSANGTYTDSDRANIQAEFQQLQTEIQRIADQTQFNGMTLLNSTTFSVSGIDFQVGANQNQVINAKIDIMTADSLGISTATIAISTAASAQDAIVAIDSAIQLVSTNRANLGAVQNRLEHTIANLGVAAENLTASESRIRDADMGQEMVNFTRAQILQQAGTAMLAQANVAPQAVLQLLR